MSKVVLITGATSGIGFSFAKIFAREKYELILVGRNENRLKEIKNEFGIKEEIKVSTYTVDFSERNAVENLWISIEESFPQVDVVINNAGAGFNGEFSEISWQSHETIMEVNMRALTRLSYLAVKHMKKNKSGKILNVASTGSFQAGPMIGVYYATKAYVLSLSTAIREEVKEYGIDVVTLCPGATKTEFCKRAGKEDLSSAMSSDDVARIGYKGLLKNKAIIVPGTFNKIAVFVSKILPYVFMAKIVKKIQSKVIKN
ncbi:MAG: SDR family NAD(P)-dependent oxidoreductase [Sarcina sp.]